MKRVIIYLAVIGVVFLQSALRFDLEMEELVKLTFISSLIALFIFEVGMSYLKTIKLRKARIEEANNTTYTKRLEKKLAEYKDTIKTNRDTISLQVAQIDNYDSMWEQLKATINLGDKVKNIKTKRNGTVYAMRLVEWTEGLEGNKYNTIDYKLSKNGTWVNSLQINKIQKIEKREV